MTTSPTVFVAGDVTFNSLLYLEQFPAPQPGTVFSRAFHETVGGTAAGKALNLHRLGVAVTLHGLVGDDAPGAHIRARFAAEGLRFLADVDPAGTQRHVNLMAADGGRISIYAAYATFDPVLDLDRLAPVIAASDVVVLNLSNYCRWLIPLAQAAGKPVWCDIHDYDGANPYHADFIAVADVLTLSSDALPDYRAFMQAQIAAGKRLVVCTHGARGSTALTAAGDWIETPAHPVELVDSNGAGDAFFAGLLTGHLRGVPPVEALRWGTLAAAQCVTGRELAHPALSRDRLRAEYAAVYGTAAR